MSDITITVKLFGAFRKYGETLTVPMATNSSVSAIKEALSSVLDDSAKDLIHDSVLANDETILPKDYVIRQDAHLSILPPVCGG